MMTKIDNPKRYTEEDANKEFYPHSYVMTETSRVDGVLSGAVVAYSLLTETPELLDFATELSRSGEHGWVVIHDTKDPLDGGALLYEMHITSEE